MEPENTLYLYHLTVNSIYIIKDMINVFPIIFSTMTMKATSLTLS